jgi:hypothetical protein
LPTATEAETRVFLRQRKVLHKLCLVHLHEQARLNNYFGSDRCREFWDIALRLEGLQPRRRRGRRCRRGGPRQ